MPTGVLFDTEIIAPNVQDDRLIFFCRQQGMTFRHDQSRGKQDNDTCLVLPFQLESGKTHAVTGFGFYPELGIAAEDLFAIVNDCAMEFKPAGAALTLFNQPLLAFPNIVSWFSWLGNSTSKANAELGLARLLSTANDDIDLVDKKSPNEFDPSQRWRCIFPFTTNSRPGYTIRQNETFCVQLRWPKPPQVSRPIRLIVVIDGITSGLGGTNAYEERERGGGIPSQYPQGQPVQVGGPTGITGPAYKPPKPPEEPPPKKKEPIYPIID